MKVYITAAVFVFVFSILKATKFSEEDIRLFLPFIRRWVPPPCPMNELYKVCTGNCSDCLQRGRCIVTKCQEGCDCAPQFFRVTPGGPCEPIANCPKPECGENETFRECGPLGETCTFIQYRAITCDHKCYCNEGHLRNKAGMCVPKEECPKRTHCFRGEEWAESGPVDEFCTFGVDEDINNRTQDVPGCYCKEGYRRNLMGRCVNETLCPMIKCVGDEVYHACIPKCNTTCRNYGNANCTEDDNCYPGCFCPPGYVMNDFRSCIEIEKCSLDIDQVKIVDSVPGDDTGDTTLLPTCPSTEETTLTDDSTISDDTTEFVPGEDTKAEETTPVPTSVSEEDTKADETTSVPTSVSEEDTKAEETTSVPTNVSEEDTKEEETTPAPTSDRVITPASPTSATSVSSFTTNAKPNKKDKVIKSKETKHENLAKEKETTKYELGEDEDGFGNDDI